jgi:hypothetical protein
LGLISLLKKIQSFLVLFFVLTIIFFSPYAFQALGDKSEAVLRVSQAEDSLEIAYLSVLEAERMGGDVSELIRILNTAVEYYSEAERVIKTEEYEEAVLLAAKAVETSNLVLDANTGLVYVVKHVEGIAFETQVYMSLGACILIITLSFLGWIRFKNYYIRKLKDFKPEIVVDEP